VHSALEHSRNTALPSEVQVLGLEQRTALFSFADHKVLRADLCEHELFNWPLSIDTPVLSELEPLSLAVKSSFEVVLGSRLQIDDTDSILLGDKSKVIKG